MSSTNLSLGSPIATNEGRIISRVTFLFSDQIHKDVKELMQKDKTEVEIFAVSICHEKWQGFKPLGPDGFNVLFYKELGP